MRNLVKSMFAVALISLLLAGSVFAAGENHVIDTGSTSWMLTSTALVLLMIPGLAMFYGGLVRTRNVIGTMMHSYVSLAIVGVLWVICGYSLTFGKNILGGKHLRKYFYNKFEYVLRLK